MPRQWLVFTLGELFSVVGGGTPSTDKATYWGTGMPWFSSADIDEFGNISPRRMVTNIGIKNSTTNITPKGSVVVVTRVGLGKVAMLDSEMCFSQDNQALIPNLPELLYNRFVFYFLLFSMQILKHSGRGTTISGITKKQLTDIHFFVPPLAEQNRIVAAIESAFAVIDEIESNKTGLLAAVATAKSKILSLAIRGKLVPQDPDDEPASVLLGRIRSERETMVEAGKTKRGKNGAAIARCDDSSYYENLPRGWETTSIELLSQFVSKGTTPRGGKDVYKNKGIGFLRVENIGRNRELLLDKLKYIDENTHKDALKRSILEENDLLISIAGALGRTAIVTKEVLPLNTNQAVSFVRWLDASNALVKYIELAINSKEIQDSLLKQAKVTAIPNLTLEIINDCILPLPPYAEQRRIVTAIEAAFEQLGFISTNLA